jgi:hypothetical protein
MDLPGLGKYLKKNVLKRDFIFWKKKDNFESWV